LGALLWCGLSFEEDIKFYPHPDIGGSDNLSGRHNGFAGFRKHEFYGNLLTGGQVSAGFDKNTAGTHIHDGCFKPAVHGLAKGINRMHGVKLLSDILSLPGVLDLSVLKGIAIHDDCPHALFFCALSIKDGEAVVNNFMQYQWDA
jgi:hypothetical protein